MRYIVTLPLTVALTMGAIAYVNTEPSKLYMVVYSGDKIGGSIGPLPYGMEECERRRSETLKMKADALQRGTHFETGKPLTEEERAKISKMDFKCMFSKERPAIELELKSDYYE